MSAVPVNQAAKDVFQGMGSIELTPVTVRNIFLLLTRAHYASSDHFGGWKEVYKKYVWSNDPKVFGLEIDFDYNFNPKRSDVRPAIFVGCGDFDYGEIVTDDQKATTSAGAGTEFVVSGMTTVILRHVAAAADDALKLADLSKNFFRGIRPIMQSVVGLKKYHVAAIKSSRPFERSAPQADSQFISDMVIAIAFHDHWQSVQESHLIKKVTWQECLAQFGKTDSIPAT